MGINRKDIDKFFIGCMVILSIYMDDIIQENVMSFLMLVYLVGMLKGIVMVDVNQDNLKNIFYIQDCLLVWCYFNVILKDMDFGKEIIIN